MLCAQTVLSMKVDGTINPVSAAFIKSGIDKAVDANATCLIIHLNTPGGLIRSTSVSVSDSLDSRLSVVMFACPSGAHAGSAGVFSTMAAHIAAMAPCNVIGALRRVSTQRTSDTTKTDSTSYDGAAFIRASA